MPHVVFYKIHFGGSSFLSDQDLLEGRFRGLFPFLFNWCMAWLRVQAWHFKGKRMQNVYFTICRI